MDLILILTYVACCIAIFKVFNISVNKWSMTTSVIGGIALVGGMILLMNYNHPYTNSVQRYYVSTPIFSNVNGNVIEVTHKNPAHVKKGEVLFKIDPRPFQDTLDGLYARMLLVQKEVTRAQSLRKKGVGTQSDVDTAITRQKELAANISQAQWNLEQSVYRAPADGDVVQIALRPGVRTSNFPIRPIMNFIPNESARYVAWFRQESLLRLKEGDRAEISFPAIPGQVFAARVEHIAPVIAQAQVNANTALLQEPKNQQPMGRIAVTLVITDPRFTPYEAHLPKGINGSASVYSTHFEHVSVMRQILLRMLSWLNYIYPVK